MDYAITVGFLSIHCNVNSLQVMRFQIAHRLLLQALYNFSFGVLVRKYCPLNCFNFHESEWV